MLMIGCDGQSADRQALHSVALQRQQALRNKDINLYLTLLSHDYLDKGQDFTAKKKELESNFALFDQIDYRSDGFTIDIKGNSADISGTYGLKVVIRGKTLKLEGKETLRLKKEFGGWKIVAGL
ncbi:nuclear transport factor 2 family protein [Geotalea uraniireducens]|nr:nuclear transport factor 2 family protein [Geotalea uraniireducens]